MNIKNILPTHLIPHLTDGLKEGLPLNVAYRATHLYHHHIGLGLLRKVADPSLNLIGDVRDGLNGAT